MRLVDVALLLCLVATAVGGWIAGGIDGREYARLRDQQAGRHDD